MPVPVGGASEKEIREGIDLLSFIYYHLLLLIYYNFLLEEIGTNLALNINRYIFCSNPSIVVDLGYD